MFGSQPLWEVNRYGLNMERNYTVYMHTVIPTGKKCVGITKKDPERRWGKGGGAYTKTQYFAKAIAKYGWDNITHEILFTGLTKEEAELKEIELISKYDLTNHTNGYNIAKGGSGTLGVKASEETRKRLSISHKNGKRPRAIPVICLDTGVWYSSIGEAAEKTGASKGGIRNCLSGQKIQRTDLDSTTQTKAKESQSKRRKANENVR